MSAGRRYFPFHEWVYSCGKSVAASDRCDAVTSASSGSRLSLHWWCSSPNAGTWSESASRNVYAL